MTTQSAVATNWAGNVTYRAPLVRPRSYEELRDLVRTSAGAHVVGAGHSFTDMADSRGVLLSLADLPPVWRLDRDGRRLTVGGGARYGDIAQPLTEAGFALHNLPSLPHVTVAGAVATGTHGSGSANRGLASAVAAVELLTADGELVTFARDRDDDFDGAVVSLGALGVVTALTLDIEPAYEVAQTVWEGLTYEALEAHLDEVLGAAYSVSVFTRWRGAETDGVWCKARVGAPPAELAPLGARPAERDHHPVPGMSPVHCTAQHGVPGPWYDRLPHFRLGFTPSAGRELQSEFFVERRDAVAAIRALRRIGDRLAPVLQVAEMRHIAADDLWLSPAYGRDRLALHFTWVDDRPAAEAAVREVETALAPLAPRAHWGKVFTPDPRAVRSSYERLPDFLALAERLDPRGTFGNDWLDATVGRRPRPR